MTEDIVFFLRIVPYLHIKPTVDDTTDYKFESRYNRTSGKASDNKAACLDFYVCNVNNQQCGASGNGHCPVSETPKNDLYKAVNYSARGENN